MDSTHDHDLNSESSAAPPAKPRKRAATRKTSTETPVRTERAAKPASKSTRSRSSRRPAAAADAAEATQAVRHHSPAAAARAESERDVAQMIATAAYFIAEKRNFAPGSELEDWLAAERQVLKEREPISSV